MITKGGIARKYYLLLILLAGIAIYFFISARGTNVSENAQPKLNQQSAANNQQIVDTSNWKMFSSVKYGYEIKYPQGADLSRVPSDQDNFINIDLEKYLGVPTSLAQERDNAVGGLFSLFVGMIIVPEDNPKNLSIRDWVYENVHDAKQGPEAQFEKDTTFAGEPAYYFENNDFGSLGNNLYASTRFYFYLFHNNYVYEIRGIKLPTNPQGAWSSHPFYPYFEKYIPISGAIVNSFKFTNTN